MKKLLLIISLLAFLAPASTRAASIITVADKPATNQWMVFRKTIDIRGNVSKNTLRIAADSKYWLYVNGKLEVFEGQLKRGPNRHDTYIDCLKLKNLRKGKNAIAVLVWYFGREGFSHRDSKQGGLYFDLAVGKKHYESDATWRAKLHPAYYTPEGDKPNFRLPESNIGFDARRDVAGIFEENFDDSTWPAAVETTPEAADWNKLLKREIPQWRDYGVKAYPSQRREGDKIICSLPYDCQFTPILHVKAPADQKIDIRTDTYLIEGSGGEPNLHAEYVTRDGEQTYESLGWLSGHEVIYTVPKSVMVISLGYHETGYDCSLSGSFECDDEELNRLWRMSQRTLYVNMRDNYFDCPDRERALWIGDVADDIAQTFYALSPSANQLTRKNIREVADWQRTDSVMYAPVPDGNWGKELPQQTLAFTGLSNWNYYMNTADASTIKYVFPATKRYIHKWKIMDDGLVEYRTGDWDWGDWGPHIDMQTLMQEWFSTMLKSYAKQAELVGEKTEAKWATQTAAKLDETFRSKFWNGKAYRAATYKEENDDRSQGMAVISGIATREQYPMLREAIRPAQYASPYMERYILEALCQIGYTADALQRIHERYKEMLTAPYTTLWEHFPTGGSYNHGCAGTPIIVLSKYVAGIAPAEPGFRTFQVKPDLCSLKYASAVVPTTYGNIKVHISRERGYRVDISVPRGTKARLLLPAENKSYTVNGKKRNLKAAEGDANRLLLNLKAGTYVVEALQ